MSLIRGGCRQVLAEFGCDMAVILVEPDSNMEVIYGLPEGNPNHGEMTLDQFFHMRPVPGYARYRTPIAGLWLCGAGAHPGGGVTGLPGKNAAREVLSAIG